MVSTENKYQLNIKEQENDMELSKRCIIVLITNSNQISLLYDFIQAYIPMFLVTFSFLKNILVHYRGDVVGWKKM